MRENSRTNRAGDVTRSKILDAAILVLAEAGFSGMTLKRVAAQANIGYGNLTHHYASRDDLCAAILDEVENRYRIRFMEFADAIKAVDSNAIDKLITWLLDDAVDLGTAGLFLELWASSTRDPTIAERTNRLYDEAVEACIIALGVDPAVPTAQPLRDGLYFLGTIVEGSSALFSGRDRDGHAYRAFRKDALMIMKPILERRLGFTAKL